MAEKSGMKTFRDAVHGDIPVFAHELIVINTQTYQRLHGIRQLDLAHKIYQDAVHTRFEHLIGATHLVDRIWQRLRERPQLETWARKYCRDYKAELEQHSKTAGLRDFLRVDLPSDPVAFKLEVTRHILRLATLLHDITHIPFGHMLENQLDLLWPHDAGHRLPWFLGKIVLEIAERFTTRRQESDPYYGPQNVLYLLGLMPYAACILSELSKFSDTEEAQTPKRGEKPKIPELALPGGLPPEFTWVVNRLKDPGKLRASELFLTDAIGNTICADLLDYVRRDNYFTGLWDKYDDRIFRAFALARIKRQDQDEEIRLSIQVIKGKLRHDTISNVLRILELRYDLAEKVIFHHARCAASAMLARGFCLSGLNRQDEPLFYDLTDDEAIRLIEDLADQRKDASGVDQRAVKRLLVALRGRDFYKPYYRFLRGDDEGTAPGPGQPTVGERLFHKFKEESLPLLREIEKAAGIEPGSIALYCPDRRKMMLKETRAIVCGESDEEISNGEYLKDFVEEKMPVRVEQIHAIEERYKDLWAATFLVHPEYRGDSELLREITRELMIQKFGLAPAQDRILDEELERLPTSEEAERRIAEFRRLGIEVLGSVISSAPAARGDRAVEEDIRTRVHALTNPLPPFKSADQDEQRKTSQAEPGPSPSKNEVPLKPAGKRGKQLSLNETKREN